MAGVYESQHFDDPVLAYDRIAPTYAELAQRRERYLRAVEREIVRRVPQGSNSLLDIGAGDGSRALRIATQAGINRIVLVEPSEKMIIQPPGGGPIWRCRAEELQARSPGENFEVITCLWNVLGHVPGTGLRVQSLCAIANLLSGNGRFFLDINHRYNARSYGLIRTTARFFYDLVLRSNSNGDVVASWKVDESRISTYGHVFTDQEVMQLARSSGLKLEDRVVIDYEDGRLRRWPFHGNLLYVFRRHS